MYIKESVFLGGKELSIETGKMAKQSDGAVVIRYGDSMVLVTACGAKTAKDGVDFLPLTCEYIEKTYGGGKIPGGYFKREGRPTDAETLVSRLIDRPARPLFPKGYRCDTQIIAFSLSYDRENPTDVLAMTGASAALHLSDIPWDGPFVGVRVIRVDGQFIINPTFQQRDQADLEFVVAVSRDAIVMVEGGADQVSEDVAVDALFFAHREAQPVLDLLEKLRAAIGKPKRVFVPPQKDEALHKKVKELGAARMRAAVTVREKHQRHDQEALVEQQIISELCGEGMIYAGRNKEVAEAVKSLHKKTVRDMVLGEQVRIDGRRTTDIRPITTEVGLLPRVHGSALFTRGETQALVTATLGTSQDEQRLDTLLGDVTKRFMLHYNFPPFSTGEAKPMRQSRREVGHGALAERALLRVMPTEKEFPYVVRVVSETLESNGSSSMAAVCGGSLALLDAGVPIVAPVSGIAMGLIYEKGQDGAADRIAILSDILGDEDHLGDMDFKVCGTRKGITSVQMDIKIPGLSREVLVRALKQARDGRLYILDKMAQTIATPNKEMSKYAPRIYRLQVKPDRVRDIIGPGGKMIRAIIEQTGVAIDIEDDGTVNIASPDGPSAQKAIDIVKGLTAEPEVGSFYMGTVRRIVEFGAFVEILPGTDGLVHISELANERVHNVADVVKEGDEVLVKVVGIDRTGKIRLSRKEALGQQPEQVLNMR
ncbi:MAG TPA: polyribonucleotide nucleotidyltransferase [Pseudomonadota bacterium]|nr:polyribonucleotide nucleotidyltransferase [Pseudomonadota bacterium]